MARYHSCRKENRWSSKNFIHSLIQDGISLKYSISFTKDHTFPFYSVRNAEYTIANMGCTTLIKISLYKKVVQGKFFYEDICDFERLSDKSR